MCRKIHLKSQIGMGFTRKLHQFHSGKRAFFKLNRIPVQCVFKQVDQSVQVRILILQSEALLVSPVLQKGPLIVGHSLCTDDDIEGIRWHLDQAVLTQLCYPEVGNRQSIGIQFLC